MLLGSLWYSQILFGKQWMEAMGKKEDEADMHKNMWGAYSISFIGALLASFILALLVEYKLAATFLEGTILGIMAWVGFVLPFGLNGVLFESRNKKLFYINTGYYLLWFVLAGGILAVW